MRYSIAFNISEADARKLSSNEVSARVASRLREGGFNVQAVNANSANIWAVLPPYRANLTVNVGLGGDNFSNGQLRGVDLAVTRGVSDAGRFGWDALRIANSLPVSDGEGRPYILNPVSSVFRQSENGSGVPTSTASASVGTGTVVSSNTPGVRPGSEISSGSAQAAGAALDAARQGASSIFDQYKIPIYVASGTIGLVALAVIVSKVKD